MSCYHPIRGFRKAGGGIVATRFKSATQAPCTVPCGRCIGCRMDRARDWGTRIAHEASQHLCTSFLTLTYDDQHYPEDGSVSIREVQLFLKRLRKALAPAKIRFYACGEYGDQNSRPHYHMLIFGYDFPDKRAWRKTQSGHLTYRSALLESTWGLGHAEIGTVTKESGAYVARYCLKKVSGPPASAHYARLDPVTGEVFHVRPEFAVMSTRPGIGYGWFKRYESDAFPSGFVVLEGQKLPVPRYYKNKLRGRGVAEDFVELDDYDRQQSRHRGFKFSEQYLSNSTDERLDVRERLARLNQARIHRD